MLTFGSYSAALPVLREEWHLTAAQAGAVFAGQQIGYTAAVLVLSSLTDVIGVRTIYLLSAIWNGAFGILFALFANGFTSALVLRTVGGVGLAGTYMPGMRLVVETFPAARRGGAMGVYIASFSLGTSLSLLLTGRMAHRVPGHRRRTAAGADHRLDHRPRRAAADTTRRRRDRPRAAKHSRDALHHRLRRA